MSEKFFVGQVATMIENLPEGSPAKASDLKQELTYWEKWFTIPKTQIQKPVIQIITEVYNWDKVSSGLAAMVKGALTRMLLLST